MSITVHIMPYYKSDFIGGLLPERISLAGIARAVKVSETWLQQYVSKKYEETPKIVNLTHKKKER